MDQQDPGKALSTTTLEGFDDGFVSGIAVDGAVLRLLVNGSNYAYLLRDVLTCPDHASPPATVVCYDLRRERE